MAIYAIDCKGRGVPFFMNVKASRVLDRESSSLTSDFFMTDKDLLGVRRHVSDEFRSVFDQGVEMYLGGDFERAVEVLKKANGIMRKTHEDGGWDGKVRGC